MRAGPSPRSSTLGLLVLELVLFVFHRRGCRLLLQQHVERSLDVVGVQLLVEVDDVLVVLVVAFRRHRHLDDAGDGLVRLDDLDDLFEIAVERELVEILVVGVEVLVDELVVVDVFLREVLALDRRLVFERLVGHLAPLARLLIVSCCPVSPEGLIRGRSITLGLARTRVRRDLEASRAPATAGWVPAFPLRTSAGVRA